MQRESAFRDYDGEEDAREAVHVSAYNACRIHGHRQLPNNASKCSCLISGEAAVVVTCCAFMLLTSMCFAIDLAQMNTSEQGGCTARTSVGPTLRASLGLRALYARLAHQHRSSTLLPAAAAVPAVASSSKGKGKSGAFRFGSAAATQQQQQQQQQQLVNGDAAAADLHDSDEENSSRPGDGRLVLQHGMPLFGGRYELEASVGQGTFSQIVSAVDTFRGGGRRVAVKVSNWK
jgi:hypothetical protein